ncbi:hypothetical protein AB4Z52_13600 [Rhizobium sp. 2YAF20]|uniref:hypothetical protein n=1 Tax=Rhizobium sp. 2YAF20 TaxID=3233027 RepID=UPI003F9BACBB
MTEYRNDFGPVEIICQNPISDRFLLVRMDDVAAYLTGLPQVYVVFADTLRRGGDDQPHRIDVRELEVLSHEEMTSDDGSVSLTFEVKG